MFASKRISSFNWYYKLFIDCYFLGNNHFFRVNCPKDLSMRSIISSNSMNSLSSLTYAIQDSFIEPTDRKSNGIVRDSTGFFDYNKAWLEANLAGGNEANEILQFYENNQSNDGTNISLAMDQYIEEINLKHQVGFLLIRGFFFVEKFFNTFL